MTSRKRLNIGSTVLAVTTAVLLCVLSSLSSTTARAHFVVNAFSTPLVSSLISRQRSCSASASARHSAAALVNNDEGTSSGGVEDPLAEQQTAALLGPQDVLERVFLNDKRPIILFDGVCNLCNGGVNLALDWDPNAKLRFSALQSNVGRALLEANGRDAGDISSIVLVTKSGAYIKSDAILRIAQELAPPALGGALFVKPLSILARVLVPKVLRDVAYNGVANNRYNLMGMRDECRFDADGEYESRFVDDSLAFR